MSDAFLYASPADILAHLEAVAREAAVGSFVVRVGEVHNGFCKVGLDLPRERRRAPAGRLLRLRLREGLERAGVVMTEDALSPKVDGALRGTVQVQPLAARRGDEAYSARTGRDGEHRGCPLRISPDGNITPLPDEHIAGT